MALTLVKITDVTNSGTGVELESLTLDRYPATVRDLRVERRDATEIPDALRVHAGDVLPRALDNDIPAGVPGTWWTVGEMRENGAMRWVVARRISGGAIQYGTERPAQH